MKKIRYGLIGFGGIAESRIVKEGFAFDHKRFTELPEAELVAATDLNPSRRSAVEALGLKWHDSAATLLADSTLDAVFIATNNRSHAEIARQALEQGRHVIVEKPMATTLADAEMLCRLARDRQLSLVVDQMMTENVYNRQAREMIRNGTLGTVNDVCFHMEFSYGSTPEEAATWRCAQPEEMGGPIGDVASHCLYMAEFVLNSKVTALACVYYPKLLKMVVEDGAYIKFQLENGITGSVRCAFSEPRGGPQATFDNLGYEVYGSAGVLRGHGLLFQFSGHPGEPLPIRLELDTFNSRGDVKVGEIVNIYQSIIRGHANSILMAKPLFGEEGLHNLQLIAAAHESALAGGKLVLV